MRDALAALRWASVAILCAFCLELLLVAVAKGPARFLRSPLDLLDAAVVGCSLAFELALTGVAESVAGLLVVLRLWRILYIMHEARPRAVEEVRSAECRHSLPAAGGAVHACCLLLYITETFPATGVHAYHRGR